MHFIVHVVDTTEHVVEQRAKCATSLGKNSRAFWFGFRCLYLSIVGCLSGYRRRLGEYRILAQRLGRNHVRRRIAVRLVMHFIVHVVDTTEHVIKQGVKRSSRFGEYCSVFRIWFCQLYISIIYWGNFGCWCKDLFIIWSHYRVAKFLHLHKCSSFKFFACCCTILLSSNNCGNIAVLAFFLFFNFCCLFCLCLCSFGFNGILVISRSSYVCIS